MRIMIIGSGAMGCLYGAKIAESGHEVVMIDARREVVDTINRDGIRLESADKKRCIEVAATMPDGDLEAAEVIIVLSHTDANPAVAITAKRLLAQNGFAITLQNGIGNVEALVETLGSQRVLGGISYNSATGLGPGHTKHTNPGPTWIGEIDGHRSSHIDALQDVLEGAGFETLVSQNITGVIWNKLGVACAIHPICALTGLMAGEIGSVPAADALQDRVLEEFLAVVRAKGVTLAKLEVVEIIKDLCKRVMVKPSMRQHIERGLPTEIDAQNGALVRQARALDLHTPYNETLTLLVQAANANTGN
ncbi:MAG: hypothetical protein CMJ81_01280 [Planctomycetaceae bacterium]|nr:hypothetical protein [Planctomycetaceae bacterium]